MEVIISDCPSEARNRCSSVGILTRQRTGCDSSLGGEILLFSETFGLGLGVHRVPSLMGTEVKEAGM